MNITPISILQQDHSRLISRVDQFFDNCTIGTLLHRCGIRKMRGASPTAIVRAIFMLPFVGANFYRGIVPCRVVFSDADKAFQFFQPTSVLFA